MKDFGSGLEAMVKDTVSDGYVAPASVDWRK